MPNSGYVARRWYPGRQEEVIIQHLRDVGPLTSDIARGVYNIIDLPKRISVLRREGHDVQRVLRRNPETGRREAVYSLPPTLEGTLT